MRRSRPLAVISVGLCMFGAASGWATNERTTSSAPALQPEAPARMEWTDDGPILVTPDGRTLYTNAADAIARGKSTCTSVPRKTYGDEQGGMGPAPVIGADIHKSCAQKWPPYLGGVDAVPSKDFSLVDRPEGEAGKQWAYLGFPLYLSSRDVKPGDRLGVSSGGFFGGFGRGFRFATVEQNLPAGLKFTRREEGLVLTAANGRLIYTPARSRKPCASCDSDFAPIAAPAIAKVTGDWSIVEAGAGRRQFAFKAKPLFVAPDGRKESEIEDSGRWDVVVFRQGPGRPAGIGTHVALIGTVYTNKDGRTLYMFSCTSPARDFVRCDEPGDPAGYWVALCGDAKECARRWRPYVAAADARPSGLWSVVDVADPVFTTNPGVLYPPEAPRVKAWAYRGTPVYTYYEDKEPGDIWGDNVKWIGGSSFSALRVPGQGVFE